MTNVTRGVAREMRVDWPLRCLQDEEAEAATVSDQILNQSANVNNVTQEATGFSLSSFEFAISLSANSRHS